MSGVVVVNQLNARPVDASGNSLAVIDGYSATVDNLGLIQALHDGNQIKFAKCNADGYQFVYQLVYKMFLLYSLAYGQHD